MARSNKREPTKSPSKSTKTALPEAKPRADEGRAPPTPEPPRTEGSGVLRLSVAAAVAGLALLLYRSRSQSITREPAPTESAHTARATQGAPPRSTAENTGTTDASPSTTARAERGADAPASAELVEPKPITLDDGGGQVVEREPGWEDPGPGPYIQLYQGRSGALSPNATPNGTEVTTPVRSRGAEPLLTGWVPSIRVQANEDAVIHATLTDARGNAVRPESIGVHIVPGRQAQYGRTVLMNPAPEGSRHHFEYRYRADPAIVPTSANVPFEVDYVIVARGTSDGGPPFERSVNGSFRVHVAGATFAANSWQTEREGGDLRVRADVEITRPGTYWAYAELWGGDAGRRPIAFARDRFERLPVGRRAIELTFGGLIIRDSNVDGPYTVRNIRLMQVDAVPPQEAEPIADLPPTPPWRASDFH
ncbi:MAG: hypothetical protein U0269_13430 [Polyangiales bacterium]